MLLLHLFLALALLFLLKLLLDLLRNEALYFPLPKETIRRALKLAGVKPGDVVYDLGSGDGRVLIIAAKEFGARAVGVEKNWFLYKLSKWLVKRSKLSDRVKVVHGDLFKQSISNASVVLVYLSQKLNRELEPKLKRELRKGTRIVSASHKFYGLKLKKKVKTGHFYTYLYII